jgi:hypothetical protein
MTRWPSRLGVARMLAGCELRPLSCCCCCCCCCCCGGSRGSSGPLTPACGVSGAEVLLRLCLRRRALLLPLPGRVAMGGSSPPPPSEWRCWRAGAGPPAAGVLLPPASAMLGTCKGALLRTSPSAAYTAACRVLLRRRQLMPAAAAWCACKCLTHCSGAAAQTDAHATAVHVLRLPRCVRVHKQPGVGEGWRDVAVRQAMHKCLPMSLPIRSVDNRCRHV